MKDFSERELRDGCPNMEPRDTVAFCLECLFKDKKHNITDRVTDRLTYEELIGALLQAEDIIRNVGEE
ncbi:MAG: hypothetical protein M0R30_13090 [Methanoregula sp.]|jgi:hypothetical protein|uniref:hypothetical protein n=1 Tax=Methanoregula sp. TaxID=2052170 RepID=UPI0025EC4A43|nr:hypothetical protein [Methanoregula sp.]MCK9632560.1 hypothetical protein [Methanoregula sp.]